MAGNGQRWLKQRTTDSCLSLDTTEFRRRGWFMATGTKSGDLTWGGRGGQPQGMIDYDLVVSDGVATLRLRYTTARDSSAALDYRVTLVTTPCRLGGCRWWFACPLARGGVACGRRVRKLYLAGGLFGCRACHGLTYLSRQQSDARAYALARQGVGAIRPTRWRSVAELGVMLHALDILEKRYARPLRRR